MIRYYSTLDEATQDRVVDAIEASGVVPDARAEYDVDKIAADVFEYEPGRGFFQNVSANRFWEIVEECAR